VVEVQVGAARCSGRPAVDAGMAVTRFDLLTNPTESFGKALPISPPSPLLSRNHAITMAEAEPIVKAIVTRSIIKAIARVCRR
jgi:hypothetical protein